MIIDERSAYHVLDLGAYFVCTQAREVLSHGVSAVSAASSSDLGGSTKPRSLRHVGTTEGGRVCKTVFEKVLIFVDAGFPEFHNTWGFLNESSVCRSTT